MCDTQLRSGLVVRLCRDLTGLGLQGSLAGELSQLSNLGTL